MVLLHLGKVKQQNPMPQSALCSGLTYKVKKGFTCSAGNCWWQVVHIKNIQSFHQQISSAITFLQKKKQTHSLADENTRWHHPTNV